MEVVTMPQLGETVTEGTITAWVAQPGQRVEVDDALFEVSTEKVDTEIPAANPGYLREILVAEGDTVPIGTPVAIVTATADEDYESVDGAAPVPRAEPAPEPEPTAEAKRESRPEPSTEVGFLSPVVRRLLEEHGLDPGDITGTGRDGRITRADVLAVSANRRRPFSRARVVTARRMRESLDIAAHAHVSMAVDYRRVDRVRGELGYLPYVARAVVRALRLHPDMNASVDGEAFIDNESVNLGIAVDTGDALVVPVIHDAQHLGVRGLADAIAELASLARARRLPADAHEGGTFTLTNVGGHGTLTSTPIINRPQVGICSVDGITPTPVAVPTSDGHGIAVHPVGNLSLGFDHRAIDGAVAAAFLADVRDHLENHPEADS